MDTFVGVNTVGRSVLDSYFPVTTQLLLDVSADVIATAARIHCDSILYSDSLKLNPQSQP